MSQIEPSDSRASSILVHLLTLAILAMANIAFGQGAPDMPLAFKMKGEFHDPQKDPKTGGVNRFEVSIEDEKRVLDIERADTLQGSMLGSSVLKQIYPPIMTFLGPKELIEQLKNPENLGKSYTMTGQLYVKKRIFRLSEVVQNQGNPGEEDAEPEASQTPYGRGNVQTTS